MKAGWEVKRLGEVCSFQRGLTYKKTDEVAHSRNRVLRANNINRDTGCLDFSDIKYIDDAVDIPISRKIRRDCLIICTASGSKSHLGKVALIDTDDDFAFGGFMGMLIPAEYVLPKFLYWYTRSTEYFEFIDALTDGANINNLRFNQLSEAPFPLPPLEEQKRIVAILDEAFEGLTRARAHTETNLQNARDLFESVSKLLFSDNHDWRVEDLNTNVQFVDYRGKTPPKTSSGIRLITAKNVKRGYIQREPEEFMDEEAYADWMTRGFPVFGDVLFTTEAPLANVAQLDTEERVVIGQRLITMKVNPSVLDAEFLKFALLSPPMQDEILKRGTGATVQGIKASLLKTVPLKFPRSLDEQRSIARRCRVAFQIKDEAQNLYRAKLADLDALRQSLLQKAFAGELT